MSVSKSRGFGLSGEYLRPTEVGEMVVCHVLDDAREPEPDFEAMRRAIGEPTKSEDGNS